MNFRIIGYIGMAACVIWFAVFFKRKPNKGVMICVLAAFAIFASAAFLPTQSGNVSEPSSSSAAAGSLTETEQALLQQGDGKPKPYSAELISGFYAPGVDFPAGDYNLTVLQGNGKVYVTNPSGAGKTTDFSKSGTKELKNIHLPLGEAISVYGLKIKLESAAADGGTLSERENTATKTVTLSPGTYEIGRDLDEGSYDVSAVKGTCKIDSDNEGIPFHETLNAQGSDYEKEFRNLTCDVGTTLTVTGSSAQFVPSE